MKNKMIKFALFFLTFTISLLVAKESPLNGLKQFADGLNIEGGTIYQKYLRKEQVWSNLCVVLDRPFEDGIEWQELTNLNSFPLKEASILDYNEAQINFIYATVMHYYIMHAHQIAHKQADQAVKILIQVHRNSSGPRHVELLEQLLKQCYSDLQGIKQISPSKSKYELFSYVFPAHQIELTYCYGSVPENLGELGKYGEVDIVLSFSLVAGLHPDWKSGSLLLPREHIPFSLKTLYLELENKYSVQNHLYDALSAILETQEDRVLEIVNRHFSSLNPQKDTLKAEKLTEEDFKKATLLQVDGNFNPSQLPSTFVPSR